MNHTSLSKGTKTAAAMATLCCVLLSLRLYHALIVEHFHSAVYAGMSEKEVLLAVGAPAKIIVYGESYSLNKQGHIPVPHIRDFQKIYIYDQGVIHRFYVFIDKNDEVQCVVSSKT